MTAADLEADELVFERRARLALTLENVKLREALAELHDEHARLICAFLDFDPKPKP